MAAVGNTKAYKQDIFKAVQRDQAPAAIAYVTQVTEDEHGLAIRFRFAPGVDTGTQQSVLGFLYREGVLNTSDIQE